MAVDPQLMKMLQGLFAQYAMSGIGGPGNGAVPAAAAGKATAGAAPASGVPPQAVMLGAPDERGFRLQTEGADARATSPAARVPETVHFEDSEAGRRETRRMYEADSRRQAAARVRGAQNAQAQRRRAPATAESTAAVMPPIKMYDVGKGMPGELGIELGGDPPDKGKAADWNNARVRPNSTPASLMFDEIALRGPKANVNAPAIRESTMTTATQPAPTPDVRRVKNFGVEGEYPEYRSGHRQSMANDLRGAMRDPEGLGETTPLDHLYAYYGERTPELLRAMNLLREAGLGGTMSSVDMTIPIKFLMQEQGRNADYGFYNTPSGVMKINESKIYNPDQIGARHTLGHEVLHSILPWANYNDPDSPYSQAMNAAAADSEYMARLKNNDSRLLKVMVPDQIDAVTGKPLEGFTWAGTDWAPETGFAKYSGLNPGAYNNIVDEDRVRAMQLSRELSAGGKPMHPLFEAIDAGFFENFDPQNVDEERLRQLINAGIEKMFDAQVADEWRKGGEKLQDAKNTDQYRKIRQAWRGADADGTPSDRPKNDPKGHEIFKNLLRQMYLDWAANRQAGTPTTSNLA